MLPSHTKAMEDIECCRTQVMGRHVYYCDACEDSLYADHSCGNRHCPKCGDDRADDWRDKHLQKLLPVTYFLVICPLPPTLHLIARSNQKRIYHLVFQPSADALHTLALNPTWLGGLIGLVSALHPWDRSMGDHLHVPDLVPTGGIDPQTGAWTPAHPKFLVPGSALSKVFRARFRDALKAEAPELFAQVPPAAWSTSWVVHCQAVGDGRTALKYLAPYVYRVALSNRRLVSMADGTVTFRSKPRHQPWKTMTRDALSFIQRFWQHVLPKGFQKVRSVGFLHPRARARFRALKARLEAQMAASGATPTTRTLTTAVDTPSPRTHTPEAPDVCPHCGRPLQDFGRLSRPPRGPP
jgi:hypothetical protein